MSRDNDKDGLDINWLEEIIRETEHYYQGEIQQEQRASWLLASVSVLLLLFVGSQSMTEIGFEANVYLIGLALLAFFISGFLAIITIVPLRGTRIRRDLFGSTYRIDKKLDVDDLIEARFRPGKDWKNKKYRKRVFYHYRSHYLRVRMKEYFVVWSSVFFLLGFILISIISFIELI